MASLGLSIVLAKAEFARGVTHLTAGRHSVAFDHFMRMFDRHGPAYHEVVAQAAAPYVIECAVRAGRDDEARHMMTLLEALGKRTPAALVQIGLRFARPLLADDSEAQELYESALDAEPKWPFDYARLEMSYGGWLRRQRHITESRPHLEDGPGHVRCPRSAALGGQGARGAARFWRKDSRTCAGASAAPVAPGAPDRADGGVRTFQPSDRRSLVPIAPYGGRPPVSRFPETRDRFSVRARSGS